MDIVDLEKWRELVQGGHALWWSQGEYIDHARREAGETARELLGVLAQEARCTITSLIQKADCARDFEPGMRRPEMAPTWHRAVRQAALRTKRPLAEVLEEAIRLDHGQRELDALGKSEQSFATWGGTCPDCGAKFHVKSDGERGGAEVVCPLCAVERVRPQVLGRLM